MNKGFKYNRSVLKSGIARPESRIFTVLGIADKLQRDFVSKITMDDSGTDPL